MTKLAISMTKLEYKVLCSRDFQQKTNDNKAFLIIVVVTQCKRDLYLLRWHTIIQVGLGETHTPGAGVSCCEASFEAGPLSLRREKCDPVTVTQ